MRSHYHEIHRSVTDHLVGDVAPRPLRIVRLRLVNHRRSVPPHETGHGGSNKAGYREAMSDDPAAAATPVEAESTEAEPAETPAAAPPPAEPVDTGYTPSGVPTFESVREKIESRFGTAIGAAELDAESTEGRTIEEQYDARQRAAAERLTEIRKSMHPEQDDAQ